jgi:hypothetical protein
VKIGLMRSSAGYHRQRHRLCVVGKPSIGFVPTARRCVGRHRGWLPSRDPCPCPCRENALRVIATGRKAWLFFGSDDHAQAAANLYSLIAARSSRVEGPREACANLFLVLPLSTTEAATNVDG